MNRLFVTILMLSIVLLGCKDAIPHESNSIEKVKKVVLKKDGFEEFFYWELTDDKSLWEFELGDVKALNLYQDSLRLELGSEIYESVVKKESIQSLEKALIGKEENGDRINALLVHTGSIGKIRKANYLESQILNYQIKKYPMFSHPTEFHGFILKNEAEGIIRVYFGSSNTEWPPHPTVIIDKLEEELSRGWKLKSHLHNHYCKKDKNYVGILAPSLADAQYYKMLKERFELKEALITNGFHTVEIENRHFEKFESH